MQTCSKLELTFAVDLTQRQVANIENFCCGEVFFAFYNQFVTFPNHDHGSTAYPTVEYPGKSAGQKRTSQAPSYAANAIAYH